MEKFKNRDQAGEKLAELLDEYKNNKKAVIYALPRGGVPIAKIISTKLNLPLDLLIVRKIGHPLNPEFAIGALAENGTLVSNPITINQIDSSWLAKEIEIQKEEISRRQKLYLKNRRRINPKEKITILVDDGIATGATILAAIDAIRSEKPAEIVVATPVVDKSIAEMIEGLNVKIVAVLVPDEFLGAVGAYYEDFPQISDDEVSQIMQNQKQFE